MMMIMKDVKKTPRGLTMTRIISVVGKYYSVTPADMKSKSRKKEIVVARQISIYLIRTMLDTSLMEIGKEFNRDHSTVISSINKVEKSQEENININTAIIALRQKILNN
jgi:chromosomal replication initiator protein